MNYLRKSSVIKPSSCLMAILFLFFSLSPQHLFALGTGPNQPELESFSPIGVDNMVDLFTGDFNYNLPLLTVPGPNGGYPINMTYNAGVGMEQEASWVGLGWNLNPGVVNRELRGLPDDFNGVEVKKTLSQKPNRTFTAKISGTNVELLGADLSKIKFNGKSLVGNASINLVYNNYKGFDAGLGYGFSFENNTQSMGDNSAKKQGPIDFNTGELLSPRSFLEEIKAEQAKDIKDWGFSSLAHQYGNNIKAFAVQKLTDPAGSLGRASVIDISDINYTHPMTSGSYTLNVKTGLAVYGWDADLRFDVGYSFQKIKDSDKEQQIPAYGYLFSEENFAGAEQGLMDVALMNQSMITPSSKTIAIPNSTYDVFHVKSQGVSGTVRPFKGSLELLTDASTESKSIVIGGGVEANAAATAKIGANFNLGTTKSYNGPWKGGMQALDALKDKLPVKKDENGLYEPYYFQFTDEMAAEVNENSLFSGTRANAIKIASQMGGVAYEAKLKANLTGAQATSISTTNAFREDRVPRAKHFFALSEAEARMYDGAGFTREVYDLSTSSLTPVNYATSGPESKQMGAVHVLDAGGTRYNFGIPAKNKVHKSVVFSTDQMSFGSGVSSLVTKSGGINSTENSKNNKAGQNYHYSETELPPYAHSFLLTEILSEDYADISEDGPTVDDFGDYVRFDYQVRKDFKTRGSGVGAAFIPGSLSNTGDDKMSYTYFEKDIFYVRSIATKTHIAVFKLGIRDDAQGVPNVNSIMNGNYRSYKLDEINLYNLKDYKSNPSTAVPVKTVNFVYDYELCVNSKTSQANAALQDPSLLGGKLTLKEIYFSVGASRTKASLSPYVFEYDATANKAYDDNLTDRWGTYQEHSDNAFLSNNIYPYSTKNVAAANNNAKAWNLSKITLPTGGVIEVGYESDRYQYVQNKPAQSMYKIKGFASTIYHTGNPETSLTDNNNYVIVELDKTIQSSEVQSYVRGLSDIYFKAFVKMKRFPSASNTEPSSSSPFSDGTHAYDFVEGYFEYDNEVGIFPSGTSSSNQIIFRVKQSGGNQAIKKAGWVELQTKRNDLIDESKFTLDGFSNLAAGLLGEIGSIVSKALEFLIDDNAFFLKAAAKQYCNSISENGGMSSIVRLNSVGNKLGGGHRVKSITISDTWSQMSTGGSDQEYGQDYSYVLEDGSSSGVAQYEPIVGGEENPFRKPIRYGTQKVTFKNNYLFTEEPLGEELFPSASVGYSRVVVTNKANATVTTSGEGIKVHEYYTAKDYPVRVERTGLSKVNADFKTKFFQFIGLKNFFQPGFSQGFCVELNNMHGKEKSQATYRAGADLSNDVAVSKTESFYKTKRGYSPHRTNVLDSKVSAFDRDGNQQLKELGKTVDLYAYLKESNSRSISGAIDGNLDFGFLFFVPTAFPNLDYSFSMTRFVSLNRVVNRVGILDRLENHTNGAKVETEHLAFDGETGEPIVSSVTNDYDDKIYTYKQKAKWYYKEMGPAYQNLGLQADNIDNYATVIANGDLFIDASGNKAWAQVDPSNGNLSFASKDGTSVSKASISNYRLIESGFGNNLSVNVGTIQSKNPGKPTNGVLNSSGQSFDDSGKESSDISVLNVLDTIGLGANPQAYRFAGVYKPQSSFYYKQERNQNHSNGYLFHTYIRENGDYQSFTAFDPFNIDNNWKIASTVTAYDYNGMPVEEENALGNLSTVLYGHNRALPTAVAQNCAYSELAFNGFEDYGITGVQDGRSAHLVVSASNTALTTEREEVHSGNYGLELTASSETINLNASDINLSVGKKYVIHLWAQKAAGGTAKVNTGSTVSAIKLAENIDGWDLLEIEFVAEATNTLILENTGGIFDDIKVQPFNASVKTYVYDDRTHQLLAALDENHYATFYNYDRDQVLVQVKKETQRGIKTIQSTMRSSAHVTQAAQ